MTLKKKVICCIIAWLIVYAAGYAIWMFDAINRYGPPGLERPTVETKSIVYVVPWPWALEWQDGGFVMRLEKL